MRRPAFIPGSGRRVVAAIAGAAALSAGAVARPPAPARRTAPGEGLYCMLAIVSVAAEVERRCPGKGDPDFRRALDESTRLMEAYVVAGGAGNGAAVARFRREQGGAGADEAALCRGDGPQIYDTLRRAGGAALLEGTRKLVSRPGKPSWGDCF